MSSDNRDKPGPGERCIDQDPNCRACGAEDHGPLTFVASHVIDAQVITWRRTHCSACGQARNLRFGKPIDPPAANKPRRK